MKKVNIYALINPVNDAVFYVGATYKRLSERLNGHISASRLPNAKSEKDYYISSLLENNIAPDIFLLEETDFKDATFFENFYMDLFRSFGFVLYQKNKSFYSERKGYNESFNVKEEDKLFLEDLNKFLLELEERQKMAPSVRELEREAGFSQTTLSRLCNGILKITPEREAALLPILQKYGF